MSIMLVVSMDLIRSCMGVGCGFGPHLVMSIVLVVGLDHIGSCMGVGCGFGPH